MQFAFKNHWAMFVYIIKHKYWVYRACRLLGVPLKTAVFHDIDKFYPDEWFGYLERMTAPGTYEEKLAYALKSKRYLMAWHLHQKRNVHHWEWWLTPRGDGTCRVLEMSPEARLEMLADWLGMNQLDYVKVRKWYIGFKENHKIILHPDTEKWIEEQLEIKGVQ